jgi:hypothetical protein
MSWTAEGGLSRGDTDADFKRACFYDNLEPEFILSELFWTALRFIIGLFCCVWFRIYSIIYISRYF